MARSQPRVILWTMGNPPTFVSIDATLDALGAHGYIADRPLATTVYLAARLGKPIFVEGEPGVGKTELAKTIARVAGSDLIRLQCHEGLDTGTALYEWNYSRQLLELRLQEARGVDRAEIGAGIFAEDFLLERPLLRALRAGGPGAAAGRPVLLIDEIDRTDAEFEAFLLEFLSDFQISIPEIGTIAATVPPLVVLTSNRTRELHDALKRRCLYHWIDYPAVATEVAIVQARVPGIGGQLADQLAYFMRELRAEELYKRPGVAETVDWGLALVALGAADLDAATVQATLGCILKYKSDLDRLDEPAVDRLVAAAAEARAFALAPMTQ